MAEHGRGNMKVPLEHYKEVAVDLADAISSFYSPWPQVVEKDKFGYSGLVKPLDTVQKEFRFTQPRIVIIPRSGYMVGDIIARRWRAPAVSILHACIGRVELGKFQYGQFPTPEEVEGQSLVVIDSVSKSGETLQEVRSTLELAGAGMVKTAVLFNKPKQNTTGITPDFVGSEFRDGSFLVLPGEEEEHMSAGARQSFPGVA